MSGPKVVRIVTREEVLARCRGLLAQLDDAVEAWESVGRRNSTVTNDDVREAHRRREQIRRLLAADSFVEMQKEAEAEVEFLWADQQDRLATAAARAAEAASASRRNAAVAQAVLQRVGDVTMPVELHERLKEVAAGRVEDGAAVARALSLLVSKAESKGVTDRQRKLANGLQVPGKRDSLAEWLSRHMPQPPAHTERLAARIASLGALAGEKEATPLLKRLRAAEAVSDSRRAQLLIDSLEADIRVGFEAARRRHELRAGLLRLAAELSATEVAQLARLADSLRDRIDDKEEALRTLEAGARRALDRHRAAAAAHARRVAVLAGLAALGYQVAEGMETAWVQDGRVVIRHGTRIGYGVELASPTDTDLLQVRAVAFRSPGAPADTVRDTDAETLWCGDLNALEERLADSGGGIQIERAHPIGAVPLRVVTESADDAPAQARSTPARKRHLE
jgi:hypothetical protein